jgi:protein dithiol oxidoreductase (disulfide-forming)
MRLALAALLWSSLIGIGLADGAGRIPQPWTEGTHYERLPSVSMISSASNRVRVVEFFWYGCPHCYALEPQLAQWLKSRPEYIDFVKVPVGYRHETRAHARLFYTLRALGREELDAAVFTAIHQDGNRLVVKDDDEKTMDLLQAFANRHGLDPEKFRRTYGSASVNAQADAARDLAVECRVDGVPAMVINGLYKTDLVRMGSADRLFAVIEHLASSEYRQKQARK